MGRLRVQYHQRRLRSFDASRNGFSSYERAACIASIACPQHDDDTFGAQERLISSCWISYHHTPVRFFVLAAAAARTRRAMPFVILRLID